MVCDRGRSQSASCGFVVFTAGWVAAVKQRVLVCGGRDYSDRRSVYAVLDTAHAANPIELLITGGAAGVDSLAFDWARAREVKTQLHNADWENEGRAAGPKRNQRMLDEGKPHMVIAFPGGRGTADMVRRAEAAGVPVAKVRAGDVYHALPRQPEVGDPVRFRGRFGGWIVSITTDGTAILSTVWNSGPLAEMELDLDRRRREVPTCKP